ncbi:MAG: CPXCG motif-containing cysteine-rich protein [bacterium]
MKDTAEILCPYCGQPNEIYIDFSGGQHQKYVEDCQVCCRPFELQVTLTQREPIVVVKPSNE